ncbi:unnamed protein product [Sphagnum jensenii]|uniref:Uncharacterized protein n=1 Tax=Sphagnum jensenii TaxID=128206 RepID=A0ABP0VTG4_9BRYO
MNVLRPAERVALASSWMYCIRKDGVVVSRLLRHTLLSGLGALGSSSSGFCRPDNPILHCGGPSDLPSGSQSLHIDLAESRFRHPISSIPGRGGGTMFPLSFWKPKEEQPNTLSTTP